ncbi:hypothetical protein [Photobacterium salinisoli]|uniref:hypothetical protein n=1 Tax=Photobacterium salinisoli TaxID=1616783 RepID=UPI000EA26D17|nr:hypothetical protein [Photobacterium salinisoli]
MENLTIVDVISLIASLASLILAVVAIQAAKSSEREVRNNFEKTQNMMVEYESRMKDVLSEIDKKSAVIERTVSESQRELMSTMTNIINETVIPKKRDMGEELGIQFLQSMMSNPQQAGSMIEGLAPLIDLMEKHKG